MSHLTPTKHIRHKVKRFTEKALGVHFYVSNRMPHGLSYPVDIMRTGHAVKQVFDVGANVGQSALIFREQFSRASIQCFEPVASTFRELTNNVAHPNTYCHQMALGSKVKQEKIYHTRLSATNTMIEPANHKGFEIVDVLTVDAFSKKQGINHIDLLKIDTEGFDLEVIRGADVMLTQGKIAFVIAELGFHPGGSHVLFDDFRNIMMTKGFSVFGFYDQTVEWSGERRIRYANVLFARDSDEIDGS